MEAIKKVFVIHKTHLDMGFTELAADVMDRYMNHFIPQAIELAQQCNQGGKKNFVWTVGSLLVQHYLEHSPQRDKLVQAIEDGNIAWHGLAVTTHTELMDDRLVRYNLGIAKSLDERFGRHTIAAKMTDVPGHTHALVPYLVEFGMQYLHIGVNSSSRVPKLPTICRLRYGGREIIVHYAGTYGAVDSFGEFVMEFAHTQDNMGPPTAQKVQEDIKRLQEKYPHAEVVSATLDDFAREVIQRKDSLPIVDLEIGDTWIHGAASDPFKMGLHRKLLKLGSKWAKETPEAVAAAKYNAYMQNLLMVCEHTWGMDSKRWLSDYKNWDKESFGKARQLDHPTLEDMQPACQQIIDCAQRQKDFEKRSYLMLERSWEEQRQYLYEAIALLPTALQTEAQAEMALLRPKFPALTGLPTQQRQFTIDGYVVEVQPDGALRLLQDNRGNSYRQGILGSLIYSVFSADTVWRNYLDYNRDLERTREWSEPDFAKPGLHTVPGLEDRNFSYQIQSVYTEQDCLTLL